jgi:colicin import membrane protein
MKGSLITSLCLHAGILLAALVVLPNPTPFEIKPQDAIQVDISQIGDVSKRMTMVKDEEPPKEKPQPKKSEVVKTEAPAEKIDKKVQKAVKEAAAEPPPEPKKEELPDPNEIKDLIKDTVAEQPKPKEEPKPEPPKKAEVKPKEKPKQPEKKKEKLDVDQLEAFLNKVDESKAPEQTSETGAEPIKGNQNMQGTDDQIVGTIVDALVTRVKECWTVPPGVRDANMSVRIHFDLNLDGTLVGEPTVESYDSNPLFQVTAQSAISALKGCQAYDFLPKDRYDLWKSNTLDFNPNLMFAT